jgi:hypothetical protein
MTATHVIDRLDVELEFDTGAAGMPDETELTRLVKKVLLPAVDDVLRAMDDPDGVLTIPEIALDLGEFEYAQLDAQAPARLRELLRDALAAARRAARQPGSGAHAPVHMDAAASELAQLAAFLASGRMPWHADLKRRDLHVALLARALERAGDGLLRMLDAALARPGALRRLAEQFPAAQLRAVLALRADRMRADSAGAAAWEAGLAATVARLEGRPPAVAGAALPADADADAAARVTDGLAALARYLRSGRLDVDAASEREAAELAHVALLDAALAGRADALHTVVRAALAHADGARRLVEQFPLRQLMALVRTAAPDRAAALLSLFAVVLDARPADMAYAQGRGAAWLLVLRMALDGTTSEVDWDAGAPQRETTLLSPPSGDAAAADVGPEGMHAVAPAARSANGAPTDGRLAGVAGRTASDERIPDRTGIASGEARRASAAADAETTGAAAVQEAESDARGRVTYAPATEALRHPGAATGPSVSTYTGGQPSDRVHGDSDDGAGAAAGPPATFPHAEYLARPNGTRHDVIPALPASASGMSDDPVQPEARAVPPAVAPNAAAGHAGVVYPARGDVASDRAVPEVAMEPARLDADGVRRAGTHIGRAEAARDSSVPHERDAGFGPAVSVGGTEPDLAQVPAQAIPPAAVPNEAIDPARLDADVERRAGAHIGHAAAARDASASHERQAEFDPTSSDSGTEGGFAQVPAQNVPPTAVPNEAIEPARQDADVERRAGAHIGHAAAARDASASHERETEFDPTPSDSGTEGGLAQAPARAVPPTAAADAAAGHAGAERSVPGDAAGDRLVPEAAIGGTAPDLAQVQAQNVPPTAVPNEAIEPARLDADVERRAGPRSGHAAAARDASVSHEREAGFDPTPSDSGTEGGLAQVPARALPPTAAPHAAAGHAGAARAVPGDAAGDRLVPGAAAIEPMRPDADVERRAGMHVGHAEAARDSSVTFERDGEFAPPVSASETEVDLAQAPARPDTEVGRRTGARAGNPDIARASSAPVEGEAGHDASMSGGGTRGKSVQAEAQAVPEAVAPNVSAGDSSAARHARGHAASAVPVPAEAADATMRPDAGADAGRRAGAYDGDVAAARVAPASTDPEHVPESPTVSGTAAAPAGQRGVAVIAHGETDQAPRVPARAAAAPPLRDDDDERRAVAAAGHFRPVPAVNPIEDDTAATATATAPPLASANVGAPAAGPDLPSTPAASPAAQRTVDLAQSSTTAPGIEPDALLARLLDGTDARARESLRAALARVLAAPDGARRLATVIPERQRGQLVRLLAPATADTLLAAMREAEERIASSRCTREHAARLRVRCWEQVLEMCRSGTAAAPDALRTRLRDVLAQPSGGARGMAPSAAFDHLIAFLRGGRLPGSDATPTAHVALLDALLARMRHAPARWAALAQALADARALRRLVEQFPESQLREILCQALPDEGAAWLALADGVPAADRTDAPASAHRRLGVWSVLLEAAVRTAGGVTPVPDAATLRERIDAAARQAAEGAGTAPAGADVALLQAVLRGERVAPGPGWLGAMLARDAAAVVTTLTASEGGARPRRLRALVAACPETDLPAFVHAAAGGAAAALLDVVAAMRACARGHAGYPIATAWCDVLDTALSAPSAAAVARLRARLLGDAARRLRGPAIARAAGMPTLAAPCPERDAARALRRLLADAGRIRAGAASLEAPPSPHAVERPAPAAPGGIGARVVQACRELAGVLADRSAERLDHAGWLERIRALLGGAGRVPPERRQVMVAAIDATAAAHARPLACLRLAAEALARGAVLDLEAIARAASAPSAGPRQAVADMLLTPDGAPVPAAWTALLADRQDAVRDAVRLLVAQATWRAALADGLPERMLADVAGVADPAVADAMRTLLESGDAFAGALGAAWRRRLWRGVLGVLARAPALSRDAVCAEIVRTAAGSDPAAQAAQPSREAPDRLPARHGAETAAPPGTSWPDGPLPGDGPGAEQGERIAIDNAGIVLAAPYIPRLFAMFGLVRDGAFVDAAAAERAVHLLQYLAAKETDAPEYRLVFNKLLCGLALDAVVPAAIEITQDERDTIEGLLQSMVANWSALGRTSTDGLRQTFLMRAGELELGADDWQLKVISGPFDMLMDRLPWGFSIVKFAWMPLPVHVTWRE